jgi:hypothetical protein
MIVMIPLLVLNHHPKLRVVVYDPSQLNWYLESILKHEWSGEDCLPELRELAHFSFACSFSNQVIGDIKLNEWGGVAQLCIALIGNHVCSKHIRLVVHHANYGYVKMISLVGSLPKKRKLDLAFYDSGFRWVKQDIPEEKFPTLSHHIGGGWCPQDGVYHLEVESDIIEGEENLLYGQ